MIKDILNEILLAFSSVVKDLYLSEGISLDNSTAENDNNLLMIAKGVLTHCSALLPYLGTTQALKAS